MNTLISVWGFLRFTLVFSRYYRT